MNEEGDHHSVNDRGALRQMNIMFRFVHNDQQSRLRMPTNQQKKAKEKQRPKVILYTVRMMFPFLPSLPGSSVAEKKQTNVSTRLEKRHKTVYRRLLFRLNFQ